MEVENVGMLRHVQGDPCIDDALSDALRRKAFNSISALHSLQRKTNS